MRIWTNDADVAAAHWWYCNDHHAGQWSREYERLSSHPYSPGICMGSVEDEGGLVLEYYNAIVEARS